MTQKTLLDDPEFGAFMVTAKQNTYASGGQTKPLHLSGGGKLYTFTDEQWPQWRYADEWYGAGELDNPFFGRETYFERADTNGPFLLVAHMPYDGYAVGNEAQVKKTFAYLGEMLKKVDRDSLFRGPTTLTFGYELTYTCTWHRLGPFRVQGQEYAMWRKLASQRPHYHLNFQFCCLR